MSTIPLVILKINVPHCDYAISLLLWKSPSKRPIRELEIKHPRRHPDPNLYDKEDSSKSFSSPPNRMLSNPGLAFQPILLWAHSLDSGLELMP